MKELKKQILEELGKLKKIDMREKINEMGFEIIGDIAIIEVDIEDKKILEEIADEIKKNIKSVNIVARKVKDVEGIYRIAKHELIKQYPRDFSSLPKQFRELSWEETVHVEGGCRYIVNINETYFSSKLGYERERVKERIKEHLGNKTRRKEEVVVLFAGVGPFAIHIAKHLPNVKVKAVELNPYAVAYFKKNTHINKVQDKVEIIEGDVKEFINQEKQKNIKYNILVMPAPKDAPNFLDEALEIIKPPALIILYTFASKEEIEKKEKEKEIEELIKQKEKKIKILYSRKCGSVGANTYRYVVDFVVE